MRPLSDSRAVEPSRSPSLSAPAELEDAPERSELDEDSLPFPDENSFLPALLRALSAWPT